MSAAPHLPAHHERPQWQWCCFIVAILATLATGTYGFWEYDKNHPGGAHFGSALYHSGQLLILHMPHLEGHINGWLEFARWLGALVFAAAAISALYRIFFSECRRFLLSFASEHVAICGLGKAGVELARCFRKPGKQTVVGIDRAVTQKITDLCHENGVNLIVGDVTTPDLLRSARVHTAGKLIAVCGDDSTNVEIAVRAYELLRSTGFASGCTLECFVQLSDITLRDALRRHEMFGGDGQRFKVRFFDIFESSARRLLLDTLPLDHGGIAAGDTRQVHLIIIGFGRMGRSVAIKAAQMGQFANGSSVRISIIDRAARRHEEQLLFHCAHIRDVCAITFHNLDIESSDARALLAQWCDEPDVAVSIAVCFDNDALALAVALDLLPRLRTRGIPIAVRMTPQSGLATLLKPDVAKADVRFFIRTFTTFENDCCERAFDTAAIDRLPQLIQVRFIDKGTRLHGRDAEVEKALRDWDKLPEDFKDSNRQQADHLVIKLRAIGCEIAEAGDPRPEAQFTDDEVKLLAELEHRRWVAERTLANWTLAPAPKNETLRTNPNLKPWNDLLDDVKSYDFDTIAAIPHLLAELKKKVCRRQPIP